MALKEFRVLSGPFRGAPILANWRGGKRKILGIYEHELNPWWARTIVDTDLFYDVGAADGYLTRGVAHKFAKRPNSRIVAFEPGMEATNLSSATRVPKFSEIDFELIPKLVGKESTPTMTTLDAHFYEPLKKAIVKIDVEGAEIEVLSGAQRMLSHPGFEWTVEIHGRDLIDPVQAFFEESRRAFEIVEPKPHWLFGAESRSEWTGWLVTI